MIVAIIALIGAALASTIGTGLMRRYALRNAVLDHPNERSSHTQPTPRGGGVAIVAVVLATVAALAAADLLDGRVALALGAGGAAIALIGWIDDHRALAPAARAAVHVAAAGWAVYWLGGLPELDVGTRALPLSAAGHLLALLGVVWLVSLFNFMDGIDGIAGGEAITVGGTGAALLLATGNGGLALLSAAIAAAAAGFLVWNWPPARIFMGDAGSGFLGFAFAVLALASDRVGGPPLLVWLLLLGVFVVDATLTLLRRVGHGERWYAAHRSHAYQRLVQSGRSHRAVTSGVLGVNLVLGLLAWAGTARPALLPAALLVAAALLAGLYLAVERIRGMRPNG